MCGGRLILSDCHGRRVSHIAQSAPHNRSWNYLRKSSISGIWPRVAWSHCATPLFPNFTMVLVAYHRRKDLRTFCGSGAFWLIALVNLYAAFEYCLLTLIVSVLAHVAIIGVNRDMFEVATAIRFDMNSDNNFSLAWAVEPLRAKFPSATVAKYGCNDSVIP